jgi:sterol desaturase/sphingolipid hydroxylase (fatty acid hydroxylase superfamily)
MLMNLYFSTICLFWNHMNLGLPKLFFGELRQILVGVHVHLLYNNVGPLFSNI